jgi:hypothetical protein
MNALKKHLPAFVFGFVSILVLVLTSLVGLPSGMAAPGPTTVSEGGVTLSGGYQTGHFPEIYDATACDMNISFTYDGNGLVDQAGAHAWSELGIRDLTTTADFNPNGKGIWLATDYDYTANTFAPDPVGSPTLDLDDKLILQKVSGQGEGAYNLPSTPALPGNNHNFWFDRDGVDQYQAASPLAVDGGTYNTGGFYNIDLTFHATSATTGTAYMTINGLAQGFEVDGNWNTIELTPAGMSFSADMTRMRVFYGLYGYGYGAIHSVAFNDIQVTGCFVPPDTKDQCKYDEWMTKARADGSTFKNQGDCIQYFNTGK